eukprot:gene4436-14572_t
MIARKRPKPTDRQIKSPAPLGSSIAPRLFYPPTVSNMSGITATPEPVVYNPPAKVEELFGTTAGNKFASINAPTAGAREQKALPAGSAPIQLYSLGTPNGWKVSILLEELADAVDLDYDAYNVDISKGEQFTSGFVDVNPNSKIPALVDKDGPNGKPIHLFETGSINLYLAEKYKKFLPTDIRLRSEVMNWCFWQMGGQGPMTGAAFGHFFAYAPDDKGAAREYSLGRYGMEVQRLCAVLDLHLEGKTYMVGEEYSLADIMCFPWFHQLRTGYVHKSGVSAAQFLSIDKYKNAGAWADRILARPAVERGLKETVNEVKSTNPAAHHGLPSHFPPGASGKGINLTGEETVNGAKSVNPTWHHGLPPQFPLGTKEKGITTRSPGTDLPTRVRGAPWLAGALAALVLSTSSLSLPQAAKADRLDVGRFDFAMRKLERDDGTGVEESLSGRLIGLVAVNVIGFQLVQMFLRKASDRSEPISVVKLQLGLLKDHNEIQNKLSELRGIIQVGKKGQWIILEETIRELSSHRSACSYAEVTNQAIESKEEAHKLFNKVAAQEMDKANNVEVLEGKEEAHKLFNKVAAQEMDKANGREGLAISSDSSATETESDTEGGGGGGGGGGFMGGWFRSGSKRQIQSEACVVTLIVSARGRLDMSSRTRGRRAEPLSQTTQECMIVTCDLREGNHPRPSQSKVERDTQTCLSPRQVTQLSPHAIVTR